jgi:WXG100 family type VII secretion target
MAGIPNIQTVQPGMQHAAQVFGDKASEFTQELQRVNSLMASLQSTWRGKASGQFNRAMDDWERSFQLIINKLVNMMEIMGVNTKQFVSAEDNAVSTAQSFGAALPGV